MTLFMSHAMAVVSGPLTQGSRIPRTTFLVVLGPTHHVLLDISPGEISSQGLILKEGSP